MKIFKAILNALSWIFIFVLAGYIIVDSFLPNYTIPIFDLKPLILKSIILKILLKYFNKQPLVGIGIILKFYRQ